MARMPRGERRSVPDPAGELYDEMIREERRKRQVAEAGGPPPSKVDDYFSPFHSRLSDLDLSSRARPAAAIDGASIDPRCVVPTDRNQVSPDELADRRRAIERAFFIADHPLGGAAFALATLVGASSKARDGALIAGGTADAVMSGAAIRGEPLWNDMPPPPVATPSPSTPRPNIRYRPLNANGQATGVNSTVTAPMLGTGTRARRNPPGWQGNGNIFNEARAHLQARSLGGLGSDMRNVVTMTNRGANAPEMANFERGVARRVRAGEVVDYSVTPLYREGALPPAAVLLAAQGSRGDPMARVIENPAGRRR